MKRCQRCNAKTNIYKMSMFNTQMCCMVCIEVEKKHPEYKEAVKQELYHCRKKNFNFKGIGLPDGFSEFLKINSKSAKDYLDKNSI